MQYANIKNAIGSYSYINENNKVVDPLFCMVHYKDGTVYGFNESYTFDGEIIQGICKYVPNNNIFTCLLLL